MFFKKHHIVIFSRGAQGENKRLDLHLWLLCLAALFMLALLVGNIWLLKEYFSTRHLPSQLEAAEKSLEEQHVRLLSLQTKIQDISRNFSRVERFDAKLRQMFDVDSKLGSVQSSNEKDAFNSPLPVHRPNLMARRMQNFLTLLEGDIHLEEVHQQELLHALRNRQKSLSTSPSIRPLHGRINSSFGYRRAPFGGHRSFHKGIDIKGTIGAPIVATAAGTVTRAGFNGAYGICVDIDHGGGIVTKYAHLQLATVKVGAHVKRGDLIGRVGMTGRTTGPHLHYEVVVNGVPRDPVEYFLD